MANKETVRKLPMKLIKDDYDKYKEVIDIDFEENGKTYRVKLNPFFEPTRINRLIQRFSKDLKAISDNGKLDFSDELIPQFMLYHILLEFSDFPSPNTESIENRVSYFSQVINTKYYKEVTDFMIQEQVNLVWDKIIDLMKVNEKINGMVKKAQADVKNLELKSPELKNLLSEA